jgi:maltose O-acetyltransferase
MGEHWDLMVSGERYRADAPELLAARLRCALLLETFNATSVGDRDAARALLGEILGELGEGTQVMPPLRCDYGVTTRIGARCFVNYDAIVLDSAPVAIGDDVQIGPSAQLLTATHPLGAAERREGWEFALPIAIGDGAWLGGGVIVCPGVTIGEQAVIGAGSVVTKDVPPGVLAVGNPCRVLRKIG